MTISVGASFPDTIFDTKFCYLACKSLILLSGHRHFFDTPFIPWDFPASHCCAGSYGTHADSKEDTPEPFIRLGLAKFPPKKQKGTALAIPFRSCSISILANRDGKHAKKQRVSGKEVSARHNLAQFGLHRQRFAECIGDLALTDRRLRWVTPRRSCSKPFFARTWF
jgi:hypothetical protein